MKNDSMLYEIAIIGAGVAGCFAATKCNGIKTLLIDKNDNILTKFMITGKGKSNITNTCSTDMFLKNLIDSNKFLYPAITKYNSNNILELLKTLKVNYYFKEPTRVHLTDNNSSFRRKISNILNNNEIDIKLSENVVDITKENDYFSIKTNKKTYYSRKLIIATGGLSYKATGSTGFGYDVAQKFNLKVKQTYPIGVGVHYKIPKDLQGLSLDNVKVSVQINNKIIYSEVGSLMFTHYGFGGPVIRRVSGYVTKALMKNEEAMLLIEFINKQKVIDELNSKHFLNECFKEIHSNIKQWFFGNNNIDLKNISKKEKEFLIEKITNSKFNIEETEGIDFAINTGGGVSLKELNPNNYESLKVNNMFFIGEVIDLNPRTNGFNITTCYATAMKCIEYIKKHK